jgi:hypothetical protein
VTFKITSSFDAHHLLLCASGDKLIGQCTWDDEYGDGFFRISRPILGDFALICRFGGELATNKDKSTLIFKYQNSTGEIELFIQYLVYQLMLFLNCVL